MAEWHWKNIYIMERGTNKPLAETFSYVRTHVMSRNREVVDFTPSRVKNNSKLTNLMKISRIEGYNGK